MRIIRFWRRFKNQWAIHHHWAPLWLIVKMAFVQSRKVNKNKRLCQEDFIQGTKDTKFQIKQEEEDKK